MLILQQNGQTRTSEVYASVRGLRIKTITLDATDILELLRMRVHPEDISAFIESIANAMFVPPKSRAELVKELSELHRKLYSTTLTHEEAAKVREQIIKVEQLLSSP